MIAGTGPGGPRGPGRARLARLAVFITSRSLADWLRAPGS
ncbi:hypothetical protein ABID95_004935 [Streptomyces atratus]